MSAYEHLEGCLAVYSPPFDFETAYRELHTPYEHRTVPNRGERVRIVAREHRMGGSPSVLENYVEEHPRIYVDSLNGTPYRAVPLRHLRLLI